jgi:FlaA1/EpsC-like NDP-sugar epimerase
MSQAASRFTIRNRYFFLVDIVIFIVTAILSFAFRLDLFDLSRYSNGLIWFLLISVPVKLAVFLVFGMYTRYWRSAGSSELILIAQACLTSFAIMICIVVGLLAVVANIRSILPISVAFIDGSLTFVFILVTRLSLRAYYSLRADHPGSFQPITQQHQHILIIGAGQTGVQVLDVLAQRQEHMAVVGFLDDDPRKIGTVLRNVRVMGNINQLEQVIAKHNIDLVIIALPSAPGNVIREITDACRMMGIEHQIVPGIYEMISGTVTSFRAVSIDDLLRRPSIKLDIEDIRKQLGGQVVLVTGAGGSIGSELCRKIASCNPSLLVMLGHGENSLFALQQQFIREYPTVPYQLVLADVQHQHDLEAAFQTYHPTIVFHAAAHKHVPMLESNVVAATRNNIIGTINVIALCDKYNVQRMVMLSTDKAVSPTSVMGMSKRIAEMIVMRAAFDCPERFAIVRFGNVLGSRGSVVPLFQSQIAAGGPVTVTSEAVTRYFMSIPEAALLTLKAGVLTDAGPLFVLNMGEPISILKLAHDLIRLNRMEPGRDIEVKLTGLRDGEKLTEALFWPFESYRPVEQGAIFSLNIDETQMHYFTDVLPTKLENLLAATQRGDSEAAKALLFDLTFNVPFREVAVKSNVAPTTNGKYTAVKEG